MKDYRGEEENKGKKGERRKAYQTERRKGRGQEGGLVAAVVKRVGCQRERERFEYNYLSFN